MNPEIRRLLDDATVMAEELETETPLDAARVMRRLIEALRASQRPTTEAACARVVMQSADDSAAYLSVKCTCGKCLPADPSPADPPPPAHGPVSERFMRHHYGASGVTVWPPPADPSPADPQPEALVEQRIIGHGEGQEHAIADVNAGRVDDLIAPRLDALRRELAGHPPTEAPKADA